MAKPYFGGTSYSPHRPLHNVRGNPARATVAERTRHLEALRLFTAGHTWQEIADQLGYAHRASAYNAVSRVLRRHPPSLTAECQRRQDDALRLRVLDGWTWQRIADTLGYRTRSGAYRAAEYAVARLTRTE